MTYTFNYSIITHSFVEHDGDYVITLIAYTVSCSRSDGKNCTFDLNLPFSRDSKNKVIPRTRQKHDASGNPTTENEWANRSDYTSYSSLTLPNDLITWVKSYHEDDSANLQALKNYADNVIGG